MSIERGFITRVEVWMVTSACWSGFFIGTPVRSDVITAIEMEINTLRYDDEHGAEHDLDQARWLEDTIIEMIKYGEFIPYTDEDIRVATILIGRIKWTQSTYFNVTEGNKP